MMKNFKYIIFAIIGVLLVTTSCSDGEEIKRTLNIEEDAVTLSHEAQTKTVTVELDKGADFVVLWDGEEWGTAKVNGTAVEISITANTTPTKRMASVKVSLDNGWRHKLIKVTQNGDNPTLNVFPDHITMDFMGGEHTIKVEANVEWCASVSDADWMKVKPYVKASDIVLTVDQNPLTNIREATITITVEGNSKDVLVEQSGTWASLLPYLDVNTPSLAALTAFEEARYSIVIPGANIMAPTKAFTKSTFCPEIQYTIIGANFLQANVVYDRTKHPEFFEEKQYKEFLINNGFEHLYNEAGREHYWLDYGAEAAFHCEAVVAPAAGLIGYSRKVEKPVPLDTPTFDVFPYMPSAITFGSNKDVVKTWEKSNNGTLNREEETLLMFDVAGDPDLYARLYSYTESNKTLYRVDYVFITKHKIYVPIGIGLVMNPYFVILLKAEGFEQIGELDDGYPVYKNVAKGIEISPSWATLDGKPTEYGVITFTKHTPKSGVSKSSFIEGPKLITPVKTDVLD